MKSVKTHKIALIAITDKLFSLKISHLFIVLSDRKFELTLMKLYNNLRTARIKLIPKRGDCEQIINWRPISLLSNIYKVY